MEIVGSEPSLASHYDETVLHSWGGYLPCQSSQFKIDAVTGWISVKSRLDRDDDTLRNTGGVYAMTVMAEESNQVFPQLGNITATTLVTITVMDVNDKAPSFNREAYVASVLENMQKGMPISFSKGSIMTVYDRDEGTNSHFVLSVEKDGREFFDITPLPQEVFGEATVILRVNNSEMLDFEKTKEIDFQVVAREVDTPEKRSSSATVLLKIQDMNDNAPVFRSDTYDLHVKENARIGTVISQITATDADVGDNGRVSYYLKGAMKRFQVSASTGVIFVSDILDREFRDAYYMTLEARDGGGFRTTVPLTIYVDDVNDNAPIFRRQEHAEIIREGQPFFSRSLVVEAKDNDKMGTINSRVKYKIVDAPGNLTNNFTIDEFRGEVSLNNPLDYEGLDPDLNGKIIITVMAYDMGSPSMNSTTNVTVTVEDENDNIPIFERRMYFSQIEENSLPGTSVSKVHANDADISSPNNEVIYRIDSGAFDKFRMDASSGTITVEKGAILDREMMAKYVLNVSAIDRGTPSNHGRCQVIVYIGDKNDEAPYFDKNEVYLTVTETQPRGSIVHTVSAHDDDLDSDLEYSTLSDNMQAYNGPAPVSARVLQNIKKYFDIHRKNGSVYIRNQPDREEAEKVILPIMVKDLRAVEKRGSTNKQTAVVTLKITILDANDNPPDFEPSNIYYANVSEALPIDSEVLTVKATDRDTNQQIWFSIANDPMDSFKIKSSESHTGIIRLKRQLDREQFSNLTLSVLAIDERGISSLTSTASIYIRVKDVNDNSPRFTTQQYVYSVRENSPLNTRIATIRAVDADEGAFGRVYYSLETTDQDLPFKINENTGEITVSGSIDRESRSTFTMGIIAKDNKQNPNKQRSSHERITVNVIDVNDNVPVFTQTGHPLVQLQEVEPVGSEVYTVKATDADEGINGKVIYTLETNHADRGLFRISNMKGKMKINRSLKDKIGMHNITVIATDSGNPRQSAKMKVYFEVLDVNLHNPKFVYPVEGVKLLIPEGGGPGSVVMQVNATDEDHGYNGEVRYFLLRDADWQKFDLDQTTGMLTTRNFLDRELQKSYSLHIKATDSGKPPRAVTTTLHIEIQDSNDNAPEFNRKKYPFPYKLYGPEESQTAYVGSVAIAEDKDSEENSVICYYIIGGEMVDYFWLNQTSGGLYIQRRIDREKHSKVNLLINATNTCFQHKLRGVALHPEDFYTREIKETSYLWVQVVITDINDNPPKYRRKKMSVGVTRDTDFGTTIFELQYEVDDPDIGNNSVHTFKQFGNIRISDGLKKLMSRDPVTNKTRQPFIVNSNGSVITNMFFQANMHGSFVLPVLVTDSRHNSDIANLTGVKKIYSDYGIRPTANETQSPNFCFLILRYAGYI
ncbi:cadherin-23 [Octopus bimaculoides]|uniref:cadherin-23 n=1 Tax=Octopus bimaculoides TaxID=37653 RepID=UPI0022E2D56C|nr:cadherin-23 [Octopus bimaculoides]